ncbi:uncharacterized protein LOC102777938 [Neolamprologus brichardi]|uniref:uncharacterized protein LOC102777938 n=1 Tax=Neolamprologus brichardi TaxID=32507 RepID=UPI001643A14E|nr:uncharacterized protein LOC102777938 [Neolamprologus brichardi]
MTVLWAVFTWAVKGILCTCRFLWICPYNAIRFLPRENPITEGKSHQLKQVVEKFSFCSVRSWRKSQGPHRVFVPHSPMDLQLGHQVRIMLPSGRISTGVVRFLGHLQGEVDLHLGVELQTPDSGLCDGSHLGHSYFECKPGYGAFVPFHKLLMAWE